MSRILMVSTSFPRFKGDHAGHFVGSLADHLANNTPITIIAPDHPLVSDSWQFRDVSVNRFKWSGWDQQPEFAYRNGILENLRKHPCLIFQIPRFLKSMGTCIESSIQQMRFDAVISHWIFPCSWLTAQKIFAGSPGLPDFPGIPHLVVVHGSDLHLLEKIPSFIRKRIVTKIESQNCRFIAVSTDIKRRLQKILKVENHFSVEIIPMGVDSEQIVFRKQSGNNGLDKPFRILYMGRLIPIKGVEVLLRAVKKLRVNY
ncbi:glycosyltransferase family 4 protein [bacterium]|nr:glycosyltransferase family 4 protein [bacterium]